MESKTVLLSLEQGVARLTLNRPDKYNSFNRSMALELQQLLDECAANDEVRCVLITGAGKGFCAGQDLAEASDVANIDFNKMVEEHYNALIRRIRNIEKPVVAGVNGVAAGAGANIALACDIIVAAHSATFIQAFSKISLIPDSAGTWFLPRLVGMQRAAALMMTADKVTAQEAASMGMVYKAVADDVFEAEVRSMTENLARMPTKALGLTKRALNQTFSNTLEAQLQLEKELQTEAGKTHDFKEGVTAFLEKRKPVFKGN